MKKQPQSPEILRGLDFHLETALTQARMAKRKAEDLAVAGHLDSVIEQLEEMAAKLKAAKEAA